MEPLLDKRFIFVTGKGGVGKTTVACALAYLAAEKGKTVLLSELLASKDLALAFEVASTPYEGVKVIPNLTAMSMNTEYALREYLRLFFKIPVVGRIGPLAKAFDFLATSAPGVKEILSLGKLCYEVKSNHYDLVIVDAPPTGHIVGELRAPQAINELVHVGAVRSGTAWMIELISNPSITTTVIVTTPEEMPVAETLELVKALEEQTTVDLGAIIVNQVLPELFSGQDEEAFSELLNNSILKSLKEKFKVDLEPVVNAAKLAQILRNQSAKELENLRSAIRGDIPLYYLPYRFERSSGLKQVKLVARHLEDELGA